MPKKDDRYPFIKLWVNDFLGDPAVQEMDTLAVGAFFLLLLRAWFEKPAGTLPKDVSVLRAAARMHVKLSDSESERARKDKEWDSVWAQIKPSFKDGDAEGGKHPGRWVQSRLMKEHKAIVAEHRKRVNAGRSGGLAKAKRNHSNATAELEQSPSSQSHSQSHSQSNTPQPPGGGANGHGVRRGRETPAERRARKDADYLAQVNAVSAPQRMSR